MTNNNDWIEQLRTQMEGYEEPAPEGLWQDIQAALPKQQARRALIVPLKRWAAAAGIAALLGGAAWYWYDNVSKSNNLTLASESVGSISVQDPASSEFITPPEQTANPTESYYDIPDVAQQMLAQVGRPSSEQKVKSTHEEALQSFEHLDQFSDRNVVSDAVSNETAETTKSAPKSKTSPVQSQMKTEEEILQALDRQDRASRKKSGRYGLNLYASNDLIGIRNTSPVVNYTMSQGFYGFEPENDELVMTPVRNYHESSKHYQPYSIGLTGRFVLSDRWSLSTGLVYTRLRSDFMNKMGGASIKQKQTLHDIGIPLNVMYRVWGKNGFALYAVAGGQADFNVKATLETEGVSQNIDNDRVQWSVNTGVGAQYNFIPSLGIYFEPGVKYYFDNGSPLENTFKDKQYNFNIQFGVRYDIGE